MINLRLCCFSGLRHVYYRFVPINSSVCLFYSSVKLLRGKRSTNLPPRPKGPYQRKFSIGTDRVLSGLAPQNQSCGFGVIWYEQSNETTNKWKEVGTHRTSRGLKTIRICLQALRIPLKFGLSIGSKWSNQIWVSRHDNHLYGCLDDSVGLPMKLSKQAASSRSATRLSNVSPSDKNKSLIKKARCAFLSSAVVCCTPPVMSENSLLIFMEMIVTYVEYYILNTLLVDCHLLIVVIRRQWKSYLMSVKPSKPAGFNFPEPHCSC